ncbi:unnamed protein product [Macrosiphum euphorbiae]|uniref:Uncharacterized protein n=1 Tax=Macrosiphum euphorbiae TaxID=13131 RepID=A0AAV0WLY5_9HEMI|nr:unnamed protein product [Macrosiphum euphorbiae]
MQQPGRRPARRRPHARRKPRWSDKSGWRRLPGSQHPDNGRSVSVAGTRPRPQVQRSARRSVSVDTSRPATRNHQKRSARPAGQRSCVRPLSAPSTGRSQSPQRIPKTGRSTWTYGRLAHYDMLIESLHTTSSELWVSLMNIFFNYVLFCS